MTQAAPAPSATEPHAFPRPRATQGWASLRQAYDLALAGAVGAIFSMTSLALACCKVGPDHPLIPTAVVANSPSEDGKCWQRVELSIHGLKAGAATGLEKSEKRGVQAARNGPSEHRKYWQRGRKQAG